MAVHEELVATLDTESVSYSSMSDYLHEARFSPSIPLTTFSEPSAEPDDSDNAILLAFAEQPFASVRQLA
jgi:hypothetical protein